MNPIIKPDPSIYSSVNLDKPLADFRPVTYGQKFGTPRHICKQFGIKIIDHGNYTQFTAPKPRLQMLIERLHFSKSNYSKKI